MRYQYVKKIGTCVNKKKCAKMKILSQKDCFSLLLSFYVFYTRKPFSRN